MTALSNGNYVVDSPNWTNGAAASAGAVTWGSGTAGVSGPVSATNSLVGSTANDQVGGGDGNGRRRDGPEQRQLRGGQPQLDQRRGRRCGRGHVGQRHGRRQRSRQCHEQPGRQYGGDSVGDRRRDGPEQRQLRGEQPLLDQRRGRLAGAVTWGSGTAGVSGPVSATNSLVGSTANDSVGGGVGDGVTALTNGNYVVSSPDWTNGAAAGAGAVTWGSGTAGVSGPVSATNSLVGSTANDGVGTTRDGPEQRQLRGEQPLLEQRRGRGHVGQRHGRRQRSRQCHEQPGRQYGE